MSIDQQTAYALSAPQDVRDAAGQGGAADSVCFWREPRYDDLECLTARFFRHASTPHVHDTYAIGEVVEKLLQGGFIDGVSFDAKKPNEYLKKFRIGLKGGDRV